MLCIQHGHRIFFWELMGYWTRDNYAGEGNGNVSPDVTGIRL